LYCQSNLFLFFETEVVMKRHLTAEERLDVLRKADRLRKWNSLDDERVCVVCRRILSGRQIEIERDQHGRYRLHCPTEGCPSYVDHWFYVASAAAKGPRQGIDGYDHLAGDAAA
jgi:hypothetical protein